MSLSVIRFFSNDSISISQLTMKFIFFANLFVLRFAVLRMDEHEITNVLIVFFDISPPTNCRWRWFVLTIFREAIHSMRLVASLVLAVQLPVDNQTIHPCSISHRTMIMVDRKWKDLELETNNRILLLLFSPDRVFVFICTEKEHRN